MSNEKLNAVLHSLQHSTVEPELISDDMIKGLSTRRSPMLWWLAALGVVGIVGVAMWWYIAGVSEVRSGETTAPTKNWEMSVPRVPQEAVVAQSTLDSHHLKAVADSRQLPPELEQGFFDIAFRAKSMMCQSVLAGRVDIDLDGGDLLNIGIATDSACFYSASGWVYSIDTMLSRKSNVIYWGGGDSSCHLHVGVANLFSHYWIDGSRMFKDSAVDYPEPLAVSAELQTESERANMNCVSGSTTKISDMKLGKWGGQHPRTKALASRVGYSLGFRMQKVDSILMLEFDDNGFQLPVDRLLVPIKVATPWIRKAEWGGVCKRLLVVVWYFPNESIFARLPQRIRDFVEPEYSATLSFVEDQLKAAELCALLDKPSAFGLCSISDTTLRIDGIGPIPARESFTVFIKCASPTRASVKLISDDGRTMLEQSQVSLMKGANQIPVLLAGQNIPQGAYTVVVTCAEGTRTSRVLVAAQ
ncbi:MAG: T9SS type A sorting domain-containing protein [Candidatus Kapabacteria bacterium]|nr:T9SS type A sorting domain-containing protein [Candidatus Kapabacteria bacterium]